MNDEMDSYIGRCLKNWTAKFQPPAEGRRLLLERAAQPPVSEQTPFSAFISTFTNRWSAPGEHYYSYQYWQSARPETQPSYWSLNLVVQQKLAH
ncbi:MAG: hypothetical protein B6D39_06950 [Anaerolineae bacterium UTCFX2]|jgi:hypothetical protein|nr:hypothetical protein [Anaerolineae bacterium]OQY91497.1 MAG: hypothetical protein B6D39_06950 [Anaerolineae bacterium UTCFX2]